MTHPTEPAAVDYIARVRSLRDEANELRRVVGPAGEGSSTPLSQFAWAPGVLPADFLPGYAFVREIHHGGQGVVYEATQLATRRRVAIKLLRPFGAESSAARRFEREAELITQLRHPNVVTVLDAGERNGTFYLIMEYVDGRPIDVFISETRPDSKSLLRLFAEVCDGVNAAHLRGIIHRDLKPANVLVDEKAQPRVVDFGLAKLADPAGPASSIAETQTVAGQFLGSLPWSSPEQAAGDHAKIDIRTDVYSLGVILYHLLTGRFPYDVTGPMRDVLNRIVSAEPVRYGVAALGCHSNSARIDDDVETIVLKCLEKNPARRYQSAGDLAADIRRYLAGEAIEAKRESGWYVLRKTLHRHRIPAAVAAAFLLLILCGTVISTVFWRRAEKLRVAEACQRGLAEQYERETKEVAAFQREMLERLNPQQMGRRLHENIVEEMCATLRRRGIATDDLEMQMRPFLELLGEGNLTNVARHSLDEDVLRSSLAAAREQFAKQPKIRASLLETISRVYSNIGLFDAARPPLEECLAIRRNLLGDDHRETLKTISALLGLIGSQRKFEDAAPYQRELLVRSRRVFGENDPLTLTAMMHAAGGLIRENKFAQAEEFYRHVLDERRRLLGNDHPDTIDVIEPLVSVLRGQGKHSESTLLRDELIQHFRRAADTGDDRAGSLMNLAYLLYNEGRFPEAEPCFREALELSRTKHGEDHLITTTLMNNLAKTLQMLSRRREAEPLYREVLERARRTVGSAGAQSVISMSNLGVLLKELGRFEEAETLLTEALEHERRRNGDDHHDTRDRRGILAELWLAQGKPVEAEAVYQFIVPKLREALGDAHPVPNRHRLGWGQALVSLKQFPDAERELLGIEPFMRESPEALQRKRSWLQTLVELYRQWEMKERGQHVAAADKWRAELEEFDRVHPVSQPVKPRDPAK